MKEEILRVITKAEEMGWITVNPNLDHNALAGTFVDMLADMPLRKFVQIFNPFDL